jgi:outer membrane protein assembly factor BamB
VAIVEADTGRLMGTTTDWKISIANVPTPVDLGGGRLLFSGGYRAGSAFARIEGAGSSIELTRRLDDRTFGAAQQTPIYHEGHVYGVRPDGQMTCLDSEGNVLWTSGPSARFGLGPFLLADGKLLVLDESATLSMIRATPDDYEPLGSAALFDGESAWAPMAIVAGRLILRDRIRMMCIDLRKDASP